jgi:hypothetical protein
MLMSGKTTGLQLSFSFDTSSGGNYPETHNDALRYNLRVYVLLLSLLHHAGVSLERSSTNQAQMPTRRESAEVGFLISRQV